MSKLTPRILAALVLPCVLSAEVPDTSVFSTDVTNAAKPWTHLNFRNSAEAFQFAIVSDRCGGHRPGVFEEAMDKLNLLEPEFVVCVGDLIEGYTQEEAALTGMWAELREIVARLTMPFFYVPGNHDVSDPAMDGRWDRIFGRRYYSFVYRDVLFLCLNSQDRGERRTGLSDAQIAWAREVLARHPAVRWTCLFMHQPLWVYEEGATETSRKSITEKEDTGFPQIESALAGRNYTVFAGHFHQYIRYRRHGQRYYVLASTGGASNLRGAAQGEFDHVAWVTMRPGGPLVVNLTLDGILRDDTYTEAHLLAARTLRFPDPWRPIGERPFSLTLPLRWRNPFEQSVRAELAWSLAEGAPWSAEPGAIETNIPARGSMEAVFRVTLAEGAAEVIPLPSLHVRLTIPEHVDIRETVCLPVDMKPYLRDRLPAIRCPGTADPVRLDGRLDDPAWQRPPDISAMTVRSLDRTPSVPTRVWVAHDAANFYLAARCMEPNLAGLAVKATERDGACWDDDSIEVFMRPDLERAAYRQLIVNAAGVRYDGAELDGAWNGAWSAVTGREDDAWTVEVAVPWQTLGCEAPAAGDRMGFEIVRTRPQSDEVLQWAPTADGNHSPEMFGILQFQDAE